MTTVFINPGAGPIDEPVSAEHAHTNIHAFIAECPVDTLSFLYHPDGDEDGRFAFVLQRGERKVEVLIPGLPLARVRYTGAAGQNIWHFPRLYIDGSSYVWLYAVDVARDALRETPE